MENSELQPSQMGTAAPDSTAAGAKDKEFLYKILEMIDSGQINLLVPSSIINSQIYDQLPEQKRGEVDLEAMNLLASIRRMLEYKQQGLKESPQMLHLAQQVNYTKNRIEDVDGDVFLI